jgi:hypothetical protein
MESKNPARYGKKNSKPISTTVDAETFGLIQSLAAQGGISVTSWLRQAVIEETQKGTVYSLGRIQKPMKNAPISPYLLNENQPGDQSPERIHDPSAASDGGLKTARKSTAYPKVTRRKS